MKRIFAIALLIAGMLAVFHAIICENTADAIIYSLVCVACIVDLPHRSMKAIGVLLAGAAIGLWHLHTQLCYASLAYSIIMWGGCVCAGVLGQQRMKMWKNGFLLICGLYAMYESGLLQVSYLHAKDRQIAVLDRGVWGGEHPHQQTLNITGQYSYDLFRNFIKAEIINDTSTLDQYTDLFIITPTTPFSKAEIDKLRIWVCNGGHLIVVTDHTDLFGHVRALEPLLNEFGLQAKKDSIIERNSDSCRYYSLANHFEGMTSNSFSGRGSTFLWQIGFSERADYSSPSFFSDNQVADDDKAGIYAVGLMRAYNQGIVTLFGDSTLFSNFAISFPSSQRIMKILLSPLNAWNLHIFVSLLIFGYLCCAARWYIRVALSGIVMLSLFAVAFVKSTKTKSIPSEKARLVPASGNTSCVEGSGSEFRTLFASAYSYGIVPIWKENEACAEGLTIGKQSFKSLSDFSTTWDSTRHSEDLLSSTCTCHLREYLSALIADSDKSSFWFDAGAGLLRECAYGLFWSKCMETEEVRLPEFGEEIKSNITLISQTGEKLEVETYMRELLNQKGPWIILGDWVLGRKIDKDTVLIRAIWQHPSWTLGDCVVKIHSHTSFSCILPSPRF